MKVRSPGKEESYLNADVSVTDPYCRSQIKWGILSLILNATISVVACVFVYSGAVYCQSVLAEVKEIQGNIKTEYTRNTEATRSDDNLRNVNNDKIRLVNELERDTKSLSKDHNSFKGYTSDAGYIPLENRNDRSKAEKYIETHFSQDDTWTNAGSEDEKKNSDFQESRRVRRSTREEIKQCRKQCKGNGKKTCRSNCGELPRKHQKRSLNTATTASVNLPAAHFESNMRDRETQIRTDSVYRRFKQHGEGPLNIFKPAAWVSSTSSPVDFSDSSVATVKYSGVYLVYAQAYIGGHEPEKCISIVQKRKGREHSALSCDNGVNPNKASRSQMQTCSVFGLMQLDKGDTIEVQRSIATVRISLNIDKTFFGIIKINSIQQH